MALLVQKELENHIFLIRGKRVMLDRDLAQIYGTTTKRLLEQVRRNKKRFPEDFAFQLTGQELANLRSHFATSSWGGRRSRPFAFSEHGTIMLASVLNSEIAVEASLEIVRAFVRLRELLHHNEELAKKFAELEKRISNHDEAISSIFGAIRDLLGQSDAPEAPKRRIGFHVRDGMSEDRQPVGK